MPIVFSNIITTILVSVKSLFLNYSRHDPLIHHTHKFDNGAAKLVRVEVAIPRTDFPILHNGPALDHRASHLGHQGYFFIEVIYDISNVVKVLAFFSKNSL